MARISGPAESVSGLPEKSDLQIGASAEFVGNSSMVIRTTSGIALISINIRFSAKSIAAASEQRS